MNINYGSFTSVFSDITIYDPNTDETPGRNFDACYLRYRQSNRNGEVKSYRYRGGNTVVFSTENNPGLPTSRVLSICGHNGKTELSASEKRGLLKYFGFDLNQEIESRTAHHPFISDLGDTIYFRQDVSGIVLN